MLAVPQSTALLVVFKAFLSSDHVSEATGKTIAITISKNGGAFGNPNAGATNATEITSGWYKVSLDTTDLNTLGPLAIRGAVATVDDVGMWYQVVSATTGGMTNLDAAVSSRASQTSVDTIDDFLDTEVAAIKAKTDNLPTDPADASDIAASFGTVNTALTTIDDFLDTEVAAILAAVDTEVAAIKAKTDNLPAAPAATGDIPTANQNADALLDRAAGVETNRTPRQAMRIILSACAGKASGLATTTAIYRDTNDTKDRITATVDADGNRSAVTLDTT